MSDTSAHEPTAGSKSEQRAHVLTDATIMMVDDEPITTEVIQMFLEDAGYRNFVTTDQSTQALNLIDSQHPDIVLLDLMMPEVSGFDILRGLRSQQRYQHLPVIMLTSTSDSETKLKALELGATDFLAKPVDPSELILRLRNALAAKAFHDKLIQQDELTGLINRRALVEQMDWALPKAQGTGEIITLVHLTVDGFQSIIETFGRAVSDALLVKVGRLLVHTFVHEGSKHEAAFGHRWESLASLGDNEFAVLLYGLPEIDAADRVAGRILDKLAEPLCIDNQELELSFSIGIATFPEDAADTHTLLANAAEAMAHAQQSDGNDYRFFSKEVDTRCANRRALENDMQQALEREEFRLHYQPRMDLASGRLTEVEALLRWQHPQRGLLAPSEFMAIAELTGLIIPLGEWVLREACQQMQQWTAAGLGLQRVTVNLSATQFSHPGLMESIGEILKDTHLESGMLGVELTEELVAGDMSQNLAILKDLCALGVRPAIDHFGTGNFSLGQLKSLPLGELKVDQVFFGDLREDAEDCAILEAIITMAHCLGMRVVAEGVETPEQLQFLKKRGCDYCQGYVLSKPLETQALTKGLQEGTLACTLSG